MMLPITPPPNPAYQGHLSGAQVLVAIVIAVAICVIAFRR